MLRFGIRAWVLLELVGVLLSVSFSVLCLPARLWPSLLLISFQRSWQRENVWRAFGFCLVP